MNKTHTSPFPHSSPHYLTLSFLKCSRGCRIPVEISSPGWCGKTTRTHQEKYSKELELISALTYITYICIKHQVDKKAKGWCRLAGHLLRQSGEEWQESLSLWAKPGWEQQGFNLVRAPLGENGLLRDFCLGFGTHGYLEVSQWLLTGFSKEDRSNHIKIFLSNWQVNDILSWVWSNVAHCVGVQTDIIHVLFCLWEKP